MANPEHIAHVAELANGYHPSNETLEFTHTLDIVTVSGPAGAGKNTVMELTGLPNVTGWTSREPHERDGGRYRYIQTEDDWQQLAESLEQGRFVQATFHPTLHKFYGSTTDDYRAGTVNLTDVLPQQYQDFKTDGLFRSIRASYITTPYGPWLDRLAKRGVMSSEENVGRMREAKHSLRTSLDDDEFYFILNESMALAARALRLYAVENIRDDRMDRAARRAGHSILHGLAHL